MKQTLKKYLAVALSLMLFASIIQVTAIKAANTNPDVSLTTTISGGISQNYIIKVTQAIDLSKLSLKYYYNKTSNKAESFTCDSAGISLNVAPYYVDYSKNVAGTFW